MKFFYWMILFLLTFQVIHGYTQQLNAEDIREYSNHGEVFFSFSCDEIGELSNLPKGISVDGRIENGMVRAYASETVLNSLIGTTPFPNFKLLQHPSTFFVPKMENKVDLLSLEEWDFYPTYEAYVDMMYQFAESFPNLCRIESIGQSTEGREILMAVISDNVNEKEQESQFLYTSTMHGDETTGFVLFLRLIDHMLNAYEEDERLTFLIDNLEIWINPLANPDGTYAGGNSTVFGATRGNANVVDLNRNFPDPEEGDHPDGKEWQLETIHFMNHAEENNFVMSSNCHGGFEVCNYPWDTWPQLHADDTWWQYVCREYADTAQYYSPFGYMTALNNGITNGYQWYTTSGNRQDYMNYFHHCREFILEISDVKLLPESQLDDLWEYNYRSLINYIEQASYGLQGTIVDEENGNPLKASVFIENHDMDESWVVSDDNGWFARPIYEGTYDVTFFRPGYALKTFENVQVSNYATEVLDVVLSPTSSGIQENEFYNLFSIGNNPGDGNFRIYYWGTEPMDILISITDQEGKHLVNEKLMMTSVASNHDIDINRHNDGLYFLSISSHSKVVSFKLIKN